MNGCAGAMHDDFDNNSLMLQSSSDAAEVTRLFKNGNEQVCSYGLLPVLRGGCLGSSFWQGSLLHDPSVRRRMRADSLARHQAMVQQVVALPCRQTYA